MAISLVQKKRFLKT